jgi:hypothetical protein
MMRVKGVEMIQVAPDGASVAYRLSDDPPT